MRFYKYNYKNKYSFQPLSLSKAFKELHKARIESNQTLGKILGDAITQSIQTLLAIGGFIILFSVLTEIMREVQFAYLAANWIGILLAWLQLPVEMALPFFSGLFEITIGTNEISQTDSGLLIQAIFVSIILGFNGFSVQAQVASILAESDIRFAPYFFARILHSIFAAIIVSILYLPLYKQTIGDDTQATPVSASSPISELGNIYITLEQVGYMITFVTLCLYLCILWFRKA